MRWLALAALAILGIPVAPVLVGLVCGWTSLDIGQTWLVRETSKAGGQSCLRAWLEFLNTWDDVTGEQGMYEEQVAAVRRERGFLMKTFVWLGLRNQLYTLFRSLEPWVTAPVGGPYPNTSPYRPGFVWRVVQGRRELLWVWSWNATRCGKIWLGWKLSTMAPGVRDRAPWVCQFKPWVTKK